MGGFIAAEIKKAGFDGVVIDGRADKPVYLWIHDGNAELKDAVSLWEKGAYQVRDQLRKDHGEQVRFMAIGVAGEKKVRISVILADHDSTVDAGFGAVMGSKNFKAIAVRGTGNPVVANPEKLKELNRYTVEVHKRFRIGFDLVDPTLGTSKVIEYVGKRSCYQCGLPCTGGKYRLSDGREGYRKCASLEVYFPWRYGRNEEPASTFFDASTLCNDYSIDAYEVTNIVNWLYACYQSGCLTEEATGLPLSEIGTWKFLEKLLYSIAYREGFGDILADGLLRVNDRVPECARSDPRYRNASIGLSVAEQPRGIIVFALLSAMEPRFRKPTTHAVTLPLGRWAANLVNPNQSPLSSEVFHKAAKAFWGSEEAGDILSYEGKALAAIKIEDRVAIMESLGLCDFAWPMWDSISTTDHVGDPDLESKLFTAVTGENGEEFSRYGERITILQRAIMAREGWKGIESDSIPDYNFTEPLTLKEVGARSIVPGPGEEPVKVEGNILDRERFAALRKEYYELRGWNPETGIPLPNTLKHLSIEELAGSFQSCNK